MTVLSCPVLSCPVLKKPSRLARLGLALGLSLAFVAQADSERTLWPGNGNSYQRFDNDKIADWNKAYSACQTVGAHLAAITTEAEQNFVSGLVLKTPLGYGTFALGATSSNPQGKWQWITGEYNERWPYDRWANSNYISTGPDYKYLFMLYSPYAENNLRWGGAVSGGAIKVYNSGGYSADLAMKGYVCEWDVHKYLDIAKVPDQNGNGYPEDAILYVDFKTNQHTVAIKDRKPKTAQIAKLIFAQNSKPPVGLAVLADTNGNRKLEIGVLDFDYNVNMPVVRIKDIMNNNSAYVREVRFFLDGLYRPKTLSVENDINNNGSNELTVLAYHKNTGKFYSETRDSKTGALLYRNAY